MIGAKSFDINYKDFIQGVSSSDFISDGGLSPVSQCTNIWKTPGLLYGAPPVTDGTGDLTDDLIASSSYANTNAVPIKAFVDDAGHFYSTDATSLVLKQTDGTNPTKYKKGFTDMASFGVNGEIYTTNEKCVVRWLEGTTFDVTFFTFTTQQNVPHPTLVYENNLFYGDKNLLWRQTGVGVTPTLILTLSAEQTIVTLGIDPGSGKMLISTTDGLNASDTISKKARVHYYDGFSEKTLKTVVVDEMVTAFWPVGSTLFIGYGQKLGYWNGAGIQFLRTLQVTLTSTKLPYKQNFTNIDTTLFVVEGARILAFGDIIKGSPPVFYYAFTNSDVGVEADLTMICNLGSGVLGYGWINVSTVEKFNTVDTYSVASVGASLRLRTNKYIFERPISFNNLVIEFGAALPTNGSVVGIPFIFLDDQQAIGLDGFTGISTTVANTYVVERPYPGTPITTRSLQISYAFSLQYPIRRMTVYYNEYD